VNADKANNTRAVADEAVRTFQRALYRAAKASASRRFHALFDKVVRADVLARAWREVKTNAGAAGVDEQTIADIERSGVEAFLTELATELREGGYRPQPVRRVHIPKADGRQRPLGIPTVRDRVVQAAVKVVVEPIFEADFRPSSYGFRPKRNAHQAGEALRQAVNRGAHWVVDADIAAFFDRIDHAEVLRLVGKRISDRRVLRLLKQWLTVGVLEGGAWSPTEQGVPQGSVISPLLANVVLHELDRFWEDHCRRLGQLIRYADDFVILCRTEADARAALGRVEVILAWLGLGLHPEKTRVVFVGDGQQGFDFLGFHCRMVESWRRRGQRYLQRWPSRRAMQAVRRRIKALTAPRHRLPEPVGAIVTELNRVLRGWGAYFQVGNSTRQFSQIDSYVRECLALFLSKKRGQAGRHWERHTLAFFRQLGVYRLVGTVRWYTATPTAVR
jgi:group II intron reverse transcriptase/maturase